MLPSNASRLPLQGGQSAYQELMTHLAQFFSEETLAGKLNIEQMFILVDGVLPIEACLYYQVLPLFLDGSRLYLGMVNPIDTTASDYVRRIVSYLHYTLVTRRISSQALQAALSAYLKYSDNQSMRTSGFSEQETDAVNPGQPDATRAQTTVHNINTDHQETFVLDATAQHHRTGDDYTADANTDKATQSDPPYSNPPSSSFADNVTVIDPQDTQILGLDEEDHYPRTQIKTEDLLLEVPYRQESSEATGRNPDFDGHDVPTDDISDEVTNSITDDVDEVTANITDDADEAIDSSTQITHIQSLEENMVEPIDVDISSNPETENVADSAAIDPLSVEVPVSHLDQDIDRIRDLPPRELLRELLARAMRGGIGRLYFERKQNYGRILLSQSGVLQSVVDDISPVTFQALINEFKRLTRLPLLPLQKTKQVELERVYNNNRVLLRFQFIPSKYGEQATLQVLRGKALQFYQQQQVARIGQDAVSIAKELQVKISELRSRIHAYPRVPLSEQVSLSELKQMLANLEQEVDHLQTEVKELPPDSN